MTWSAMFLLYRVAKLEYRVLRVGLATLEWAAHRGAIQRT
jgi:hypothetical protein